MVLGFGRMDHTSCGRYVDMHTFTLGSKGEAAVDNIKVIYSVSFGMVCHWRGNSLLPLLPCK